MTAPPHRSLFIGGIGMSINHKALKERILEAARQCASQGDGYSQQKAVLEHVAEAEGSNQNTRLNLKLQQAILTCWHDLFRDGSLSWGYDLDNPGPPFFHLPDGTSQKK